jgi:acyl carrier protein
LPSVRTRLRHAVARVAELSPDAIADDARVGQLPDWDSLRQLELMLELEAEFGVHIPTEEMLELTSLPAIEAFLESGTPA